MAEYLASQILAYHGGQLSERVRMFHTIAERIDFVTQLVYETIELDITKQLGKILTFDMLILNTDRHFSNIGIIADVTRNSYRVASFFDNGNSLLRIKSAICLPT